MEKPHRYNLEQLNKVIRYVYVKHILMYCIKKSRISLQHSCQKYITRI